MPPKLSITKLSKKFYTNHQTCEVFSSINMHVNKGEFVSIVGPSGCGKSTLFNILAGIEKETSGTILINEKIAIKRAGKFGYMLQKPLLLPWKTVEENIMIGTLLNGIPKQQAKKQAHELLERFHLLEFATQYPATLSGGMAQRIALLRTVLFNKQLLLMDEPFGALDALTRLSMQMWLLDLWQTVQSTVLFITHDIREAILLSDRIYVFSHRPAKILKEIMVNLPRLRTRNMLMQKQALRIEQELEKLLLHEL